MGSKRKRQEKKKDFQKAKLKVGKTQRKPDNHTDTSFTAKAISLPNQSITKKTSSGSIANGSGPDLAHHLSLTKHHSAQTRKETLLFLESHLPSNPSVYKQIVSATISLITDSSNGVRMALVALLRACAEKQPGLLDLHMRTVVLFLHSAMSHIQPDIRAASTRLLDVLIDYASQSLVKGYLAKTLKAFFSLMSWNLSSDQKAVSLAINTSSALGSGAKARALHLRSLHRLLQAAVSPPSQDSSSLITDWSTVLLPHPLAHKYLIPQIPQPFASLRLFVDHLPSSLLVSTSSETPHGAFSLSDVEGMATDDIDIRRKVIRDVFMTPMVKNLDVVIKEGGEPGKEATTCRDFLLEFAKDYDGE